MRAKLVYHEKKYFPDGALEEIKIWSVPKSADKPHGYRYSLVYIVNDERIICYDNGEGKGDHRHHQKKEYPYRFQSLDKLWMDFQRDIQSYKEGRL